MALFKNPMKDWESSMTEEQLNALEAQGSDVTELRQKLAARRAVEAEVAKATQERRKNPTDLSRLAPYMATPRSTTTPFFTAVAGKAPWFGKSKWLDCYTHAPLIYAGVVQAFGNAWEKMKHEGDGCHVILVYAVDEAHWRDTEWLKRVVTALQDMYEGKRQTPADCIRLVESMSNENSWYSDKLGASISEGAQAYFGMHVIFDKDMPENALPTDGIIPYLCKYIPVKESHSPGIKIIPGEFYKA